MEMGGKKEELEFVRRFLGVVGHQVDLLEIVLLGFGDNGRSWAPGWFWGKCSPRILVIMGAVGHRGALLEIVLQGFC